MGLMKGPRVSIMSADGRGPFILGCQRTPLVLCSVTHTTQVVTLPLLLLSVKWLTADNSRTLHVTVPYFVSQVCLVMFMLLAVAVHDDVHEGPNNQIDKTTDIMVT
eukprot:GHVQ01007756.1.p1 GENE.GHVQ01007756.1~~GHVQ01007756.1.p1  ORF type:complete len:106 (+),score=10.32 GHVQ01007756.1:236-553(+)